ncbi:hypothetical protein Bpfe_006759, partial [Biomphalaria pfeifferi]
MNDFMVKLSNLHYSITKPELVNLLKKYKTCYIHLATVNNVFQGFALVRTPLFSDAFQIVKDLNGILYKGCICVSQPEAS